MTGILGVVAAIAIPSMVGTREGSESVSAKRNAQNIASVYEAAQHAGVSFRPRGNAKQGLIFLQTIRNVVEGATAEDGALEGSFFGVTGLSADEQLAAAAYLNLDGDNLRYTPDGFADLYSPGGLRLLWEELDDLLAGGGILPGVRPSQTVEDS